MLLATRIKFIVHLLLVTGAIVTVRGAVPIKPSNESDSSLPDKLSGSYDSLGENGFDYSFEEAEDDLSLENNERETTVENMNQSSNMETADPIQPVDSFDSSELTTTDFDNYELYGVSPQDMETETDSVQEVDTTMSSISTSREKDEDVQPNCKSLVLPPICTITPDCLNLECKLTFLGKGVLFKMGIDTCKKRPIMDILVKVVGTHIKLTRKVRSSMMIPIPGFGVKVPVVGDAGVFVDVGLRPKGKKLSLRAMLKAGGEIKVPFVGRRKLFPIKFKLFNINLPVPFSGGKCVRSSKSAAKPSEKPTSSRPNTRGLSPTSKPTLKPSEKEIRKGVKPTSTWTTESWSCCSNSALTSRRRKEKTSSKSTHTGRPTWRLTTISWSCCGPDKKY